MNTALILEDLKLKVNLGVTSRERAKKQEVLLYVKITFDKPPRACVTAKLSDTICYDKLTKKIKTFCKNKNFFLIEELGTKLFKLIRKNLPPDCKIYFRLAKQRPLPELAKSVFEIF